MGFNIMNKDTWARKETFEHFFNNAKCTYSLTVNVDITDLYNLVKASGVRLYPTFTWIVSKSINNHQEFKMAFDQEGRLGFFDEIGPSYSVLNDETKIMSDLYTPYSNEFLKFHEDMANDLDSYKKDTRFTTNFQNNFFIASCIPWCTYTSFNVNNEGEQSCLFPMVTWGKFFKQNHRIIMPVTLQVHHAVADGYHCSLFFEEVQEISLNPEKYLI